MTSARLTLVGALALILTPFASFASQQQPLLGQIDESHLTTLRGNVRPEATAANDRGAVDDSTPLPAMQLLLHRSPETQAAAEQYYNDLSNPASPNYHKFLTNAQIGQMFGPAQSDVDTVTAWLVSKGFKVNGVMPDRTVIEFSGTAGQVHKAFHTSIHNLMVNGKAHFANVTDPEIPSDLTPVVSGVASFNDFMPHPLNHLRTASVKQANREGAPSNGAVAYLGAADLAKIYNFNPAFAAGYTGKGQTIAVLEDTNLYSTGDWTLFRKAFGLSRAYPYASISVVNPAGTNTCGNPGTNGDDGEAALDVEWSTAAAPNAAIVNAACADTTQFGGFLALANILQGSSLPNVVSISYGESESELGATENAYISTLYMTAGMQGISLFVSSGDEGAASSDADRTYADHGITVSGFTSTPYNTSVGGTDFAATYLREDSTYFSSTNGPSFISALSYVPEMPWNDSCASSTIATYLGSTPAVLCNTSPYDTSNYYLTTASGSGGPSNCATGAPTVSGVANGTCAGYAKPSWQAVLGNPSDGVRDIPDVSLMAANGVWGFYYAACWSDPAYSADGSATCGADPGTWSGFGGTSISSPIWAGIQALVNQGTGQNWGLSTPYLYQLANTQYGASGSSGCNSTLGNGTSSNCVFYDVTLGDNDVNCRADGSHGTFDCYIPAGKTNGLLSTSNTADDPAYTTNVGWDFPTGIGTVNVSNFITAWKSAF